MTEERGQVFESSWIGWVMVRENLGERMKRKGSYAPMRSGPCRAKGRCERVYGLGRVSLRAIKGVDGDPGGGVCVVLELVDARRDGRNVGRELKDDPKGNR